MTLYSMRYRPKDMFEGKDFDEQIMNCRQVINDFETMKRVGCKITDNDGTNIAVEVDTTDPKAIVEVKTIGLQKEVLE